jgi:pyruvate formate lyase activating enzyme
VNINKENNLLNTKVIYDITRFTHLDYTDHLACIVWFSGCNMRCDYCYNADIVYAENGVYSFNNVLDFLKTRVSLLDGVVLSGGEATTHNLIAFCKEVKKLGFAIKLDTNGTNYNSIKELLDLNLLNYIALDYKAPKDKFTQITHSNKYDAFSKTLDLLIHKNITFEVRTTLHNDLLNIEDLNTIINDLSKRGYAQIYYIQRFLNTDNNIGDLQNSRNLFDESKLSKVLKVVWR